MSIANFIGMMDRAGVEIGVLRAGNAMITNILAQVSEALSRSRFDQPARIPCWRAPFGGLVAWSRVWVEPAG